MPRSQRKQRSLRRILRNACCTLFLIIFLHWAFVGGNPWRFTSVDDIRKSKVEFPAEDFVWRQDNEVIDTIAYAKVANGAVTIATSQNSSIVTTSYSLGKAVKPLKLQPLLRPETESNEASPLNQKLRRQFRYQQHSKEFKYYELRCGGQENAPVLNFPDYQYTLNEPNKCVGKVFVIFVVHSAGAYRSRRDLIRNTWGSIRQVGKHRLRLVFILGAPHSTEQQKNLEEESRIHRDIIQKNFSDHYRNMTIKHLTAMEWVSEYCLHANWLIKVDDDTFVDIFHAVNFLQLHQPRAFYCKKITGNPVRDTSGGMEKWQVTKEEYSKKQYPWYCEGFGYVLRVQFTRQIFWCSMFTKSFWIDDVYVSGIIADLLGLPKENFWSGHGWHNMLPSHASSRITDFIFLVARNNEVFSKVWQRLWRSSLIYADLELQE